MQDNEFYAVVWKCITAVAITVILMIGGCNIVKHLVVSREVEKGADPIESACAHNMIYDTPTLCSVLAAKKVIK